MKIKETIKNLSLAYFFEGYLLAGHDFHDFLVNAKHFQDVLYEKHETEFQEPVPILSDSFRHHTPSLR
jgi:hypothetical protein